MAEAALLLKTCSSCQFPLDLDSFGPCKRGLYGRKSVCKKCLAEKEAARRDQDPERVRTYKRKWWAEHPKTDEEKQAEAVRARQWYAEHKDHRRETLRAWVQCNREAFRIIQKRYLARNPGHIRRKTYWDQIEKTLTQEQWDAILETFGHHCAYCLREDTKLTMDHLIPISKGGPHTAENIVPACRSCNSSKNDRLIFVMLNRAAA